MNIWKDDSEWSSHKGWVRHPIWEVWCERGVRVITKVIGGSGLSQIYTKLNKIISSPPSPRFTLFPAVRWIVTWKQCLKYLNWHLAARVSVSDCQQVVSNLAAATAAATARPRLDAGTGCRLTHSEPPSTPPCFFYWMLLFCNPGGTWLILYIFLLTNEMGNKKRLELFSA